MQRCTEIPQNTLPNDASFFDECKRLHRKRVPAEFSYPYLIGFIRQHLLDPQNGEVLCVSKNSFLWLAVYWLRTCWIF